MEIGETVRAAVPALAMPHATGLYQAVTVSVGVASQQTERRTAADDLIEAADAALCAARHRGCMPWPSMALCG